MSVDAYFSAVALLLHADGANDSTAFVDSSPTTKSLSVSGTARISTAQSKFGGSSIRVDGAGGYLYSPVVINDLRLTTGEYTIELFFRADSVAAAQCIICQRHNVAATGWGLFLDAGGAIFMQGTTGSPNYVMSSAGAYTAGVWYHLAVVNIGGTTTIYVDGVPKGSGVIGWADNTSGLFSIGYQIVGSLYPFSGYVDEVRITAGVGRYSSPFAPPTEAFPDTGPPPIVYSGNDVDFSAVSLLLHGDGVVGSVAFTDASPSNVTVTPFGDARISTTRSKFGGSSMYFDGAGDYLTVPTTSAFVFGLGDFTIEAWVYPTVSAAQCIMSVGNGASTNPYLYLNGLTPTLFYNSTAVCTGAALTLNAWNHVAVTRTAATFKIYTNGVGGSNGVYGDSLTAAGPITIGANSAGGQFLNGYIDDLRVTKGVSRYTANFTVPSGPFPGSAPVVVVPVGGKDPYFDGVALLLPGSGANLSTTFVDASATPKTLTATGNARIRHTQSKWGNGAAYFDGVGDYIAVANSTAFALSRKGFTVEAWIFIEADSLPDAGGIRTAGLFGVCNPSNTAVFSLDIYGTAATTGVALLIEWRVANVNYHKSVTASVPKQQWVHIAVCGDTTSTRFYVNGAQYSTTPPSVDFPYDATSTAMIGRGNSYATWERYFNGYMNDLRVTPGVARYTQPFTPPVMPLPKELNAFIDPFFANNTLALLANGVTGSTSILDSSPVTKTVVPMGAAALNSVQSKFGGTSIYFDGRNENIIQACPFDAKVQTDAYGSHLTYYGACDVSAVQSKFGGKSLALIGNGNYLEFGLGRRTNLSTQPFTIEFWVYPTVVGGSIIRRMVSMEGANDTIVIREEGNALRAFFRFGTTTVVPIIGSTNLTANVWQHVALVRVANTFTLYLNGVSIGSITNTGALDLTLVGGYVGHPNTEQLNGYMDDYIFLKGTAKYTAPFTPPTSSVMPSLPAPVATYCVVDQHADFDLGGGDFTQECWFNLAVLPLNAPYWSFASLIAQGWDDNNGAQGTILGYRNAAGVTALAFHWGTAISGTGQGAGTSTSAASQTTTFVINKWYHAAVCRQGGFITVYLDGVPGTPVAISNNLLNADKPIRLGVANPGHAATQMMTGWLDNVRITKGVARYTQPFTPSIVEMPSMSPPQLAIRGVVRNAEGYPAARTIRIYRRDTGQYVTSIESDPVSGYYEFGTNLDIEYTLVYLPSNGEVQNALIRDRIVPA